MRCLSCVSEVRVSTVAGGVLVPLTTACSIQQMSLTHQFLQVAEPSRDIQTLHVALWHRRKGGGAAIEVAS